MKTTKTNSPASSTKQIIQPIQAGTDVFSDLPELFESCLQKMYWSERHLVKALPKMIDAASSKKLKQAITGHLQVTKEHAARIEKIFTTIKADAIPQKCDALEGLTMDGEHGIENTRDGSTLRDVEIILSSLKVENFEITSYEGLVMLAQSMGNKTVVTLLQKNMEEENTARKNLTDLLVSII